MIRNDKSKRETSIFSPCYGETWYLTGNKSARFKCFDASRISIPMIWPSAPMSSTTSSVERLLMTSCLRSSNRMDTKSAFGLYRISIVDLPFPVKDVNGYGDYNTAFDSEKNFNFFLLVTSAQARLVEIEDFALTQTAILCRDRTSAVDDVYDSSEVAPRSAARSRV